MELSFQYGSEQVECRKAEDGHWYYRHGQRPEVKGPTVAEAGSPATAEYVIRRLIPVNRDSAEPGDGFYRLLPSSSTADRDEDWPAWLKTGRCYDGIPDESTRTDEGVDIRLTDPDNPASEGVTVGSAQLQRVEVEDCRERRKTGSSPWDM